MGLTIFFFFLFVMPRLPYHTTAFLFVSLSFRSPESVEMDEIMAAMVLTSLSCSPMVHSPPQKDLLPGELIFGLFLQTLAQPLLTNCHLMQEVQ